MLDDACRCCRGTGAQNHGQLMLMMLAAWGSTSHEVAAVAYDSPNKGN